MQLTSSFTDQTAGAVPDWDGRCACSAFGPSGSVRARFEAVHYPTLDDVLREQVNF